MCIDKLIKNDYMIAVCGKEDKDLKREFQPKQKSQDGTMSDTANRWERTSLECGRKFTLLHSWNCWV